MLFRWIINSFVIILIQPVMLSDWTEQGWCVLCQCRVQYEGQSKSSRPDLVLFRIKLKYYLLLIVARLRTRHAQYDFWTINILCILAYEQSVCQMGVENANTKLYTSFWRTSQTIPTWPNKNLFTTHYSGRNVAPPLWILSQNNKACNGMNELVKIVISLHCVTPFFPCRMQTTNDR